MIPTHPILTCDQARDLEVRLFQGNEASEWLAMSQAGTSLASAVLTDFQEIGGFSKDGRILVLAGKGHNAGDAFIAASEILKRYPGSSADVLFAFGEVALRPLALRAWRNCAETGRERIRLLSLKRLTEDRSYDLCLDGIFGFQFRPPLDPLTSSVIAWSARQSVRLRAAVDLPSGLDAPGAFTADFTYATGSVKSPLLSCAHAGRLRFIDLGFFDEEKTLPSTRDRVLGRGVLDPLRALRPSQSDKRSFGHVALVGGSRHYPGAILMAVLAALRSGAGLVTAFVPESLVASFAARAPEAIWVGGPETPNGGLALEGFHLIQERLGRANALVIGPGLDREAETLALVERLVKGSQVPLVIDADALQPSVVKLGRASRILTPHAGEFLRVSGGEDVDSYAKAHGATVVLKGSVTRIAQGRMVYHSLHGGPVLARGGSGDLLAGIIGGLLAQAPAATLDAAVRGVVWHGLAADLMARRYGQVAVHTSQLLDFLPEALRASCDE